MDDSTAIREDECLEVWCAGEDWCAITCTMAVIGNKWHPVIVHRLLGRDALRFNELASEVGGVTNKVLSNSLEDLEENGLVDRTVVNEKPVAVEYSLTERGRSLEPVIETLRQWGKTHLREPEPDRETEAESLT